MRYQTALLPGHERYSVPVAMAVVNDNHSARESVVWWKKNIRFTAFDVIMGESWSFFRILISIAHPWARYTVC